MPRHFFLIFFLFALTVAAAQAQPSRAAKVDLHRTVICFDKGDPDGAVADYNKAIAINPRLAAVSQNRSLHRLAQGQDAGVEKDLDGCLALGKERKPAPEQLIRTVKLQRAQCSSDYSTRGRERR